MRIAVIGGGVSGMVAAYRLGPRHDVTLYEANYYLGGHVNTIAVETGGKLLAIDTGFIVFNDWNYPQFIELLAELGVASQETSMSFSCHALPTSKSRAYEYNGNNLNGLFSQRRNLADWRFWKMLTEILRFNRLGKISACETAKPSQQEETVADFLRASRLSPFFAQHYLLPMGGAIWSCPPKTFAQFPIRFVFEFFQHHGLLNIFKRPQWRVICGGSKTYVDKLRSKLQARVLLNTPVSAVTRHFDGVTVTPRGHDAQEYDHVIFACHSDQALRILRDPTPLESELLRAIPYQRNIALLHTDERLMPSTRRAWASWNYRLDARNTDQATVTYWMNSLQNLDCKQQFFVSLNAEDDVDPSTIIGQFSYEHPIFTTERERVQQRHAEVIDVNHTSFAGAYWRTGFHEDGVASANKVVAALNARTSLAAVNEPNGYSR
jgi:predicted NAD/FAD-binding protein